MPFGREAVASLAPFGRQAGADELGALDRGVLRLAPVEVGVQQPEALKPDEIAAIFPYGQVEVVPRRGGLDVPRSDGGKPTVIANVAISVALDIGGKV